MDLTEGLWLTNVSLYVTVSEPLYGEARHVSDYLSLALGFHGWRLFNLSLITVAVAVPLIPTSVHICQQNTQKVRALRTGRLHMNVFQSEWKETVTTQFINHVLCVSGATWGSRQPQLAAVKHLCKPQATELWGKTSCLPLNDLETKISGTRIFRWQERLLRDILLKVT